MIANWNRLSRAQKIDVLARAEGPERQCPTCGRWVHVVRGYWTQHSDPSSWGRGKRIQQCATELTLAFATHQPGGPE